MADGADRLHALDVVWLEMQGDGPPIAIGTVAVAQGPTPSSDEVRTLIAGRLDRMPRLAQELSGDALGVRRPEWVPSAGFDLTAHVHRVSAQRHASRTGLDVAVGHVMEQPLPAEQPLWDVWIVDGLEHGWALVWRVHHTVADGVGTELLLGHCFDLEADGGMTLAEAAAAAASPASNSVGGEPREQPFPRPRREHGHGHGIGDALGALRGAAEHAVPALGALVPHPPGSLTGEVGQGRTWVSVDVPLAGVKAVGRAHGATVNDVVLACVAGGFRELLVQRGEPVAGRTVRTLVPVSMRPVGDSDAHNELSGMLARLPIGVDDPVQRLSGVQAALGHSRGFGTPALGSLLLGLVDRVVPAGLQDVSVAVAGRQVPAWFLDTVTTNVPGPQFPLYLCGRRVTAMYPVIPIAGHTCITIGIFSYDGMLNVGVTGDADQAGDVDALARGIRHSASELADRVGPLAR